VSKSATAGAARTRGSDCTLIRNQARIPSHAVTASGRVLQWHSVTAGLSLSGDGCSAPPRNLNAHRVNRASAVPFGGPCAQPSALPAVQPTARSMRSSRSLAVLSEESTACMQPLSGRSEYYHVRSKYAVSSVPLCGKSNPMRIDSVAFLSTAPYVVPQHEVGRHAVRSREYAGRCNVQPQEPTAGLGLWAVGH
jgi:hypothetical protein